MKEQYSRRIYRKIDFDIKNDLRKRLNIDLDTFDLSKISFNSIFINKLAQFIQDNFENSCVVIHNFNPVLNNIGEAEHMIITHIKNNALPNDKYVVYSPDADVFLLSTLITNLIKNNNIKINVNTMRRSDSMVDGERIDYIIDSKKYGYYLKSLITKDKNKRKCILDILFLFNILGDDFIPILNNFSIKNISLLFDAYSNLEETNYILDYDEKKNIYSINKTALLKFFSYEKFSLLDNEITIKHNESSKILKKVPIEYLEQTNLNKIIYDIIEEQLSKGLYFYEKGNIIQEKKSNYAHARKVHNKPNIPKNILGLSNNSNFGFDIIHNTNIKYNDPILEDKFGKNNTYFINFIIDKEDPNSMIIYLNNVYYKYKSLVQIDNEFTNSEDSLCSNSDSNTCYTDSKILINYFEGYTFILDLYFNMYGTVKNNFWYYKYHKSPKINDIQNYLKNITSLPSYDNLSHEPVYFTEQEYRSYLDKLVMDNYHNILPEKKGKTFVYEDLLNYQTTPMKNLIFNCKGKIFLNKCDIKNEVFINPISFLNNVRKNIKYTQSRKKNKKLHGGDIDNYHYKYIKYKIKYLQLKINGNL
jgi:hypothetical protein